jgi:hypothetical protein
MLIKRIYDQQISQTCNDLKTTDFVRSISRHFYKVTPLSIDFLKLYSYLFSEIPIMPLGQQLFSSLAVGVALILASSPIAVPVPGVQIKSPPIATRSPIAGYSLYTPGIVLQQRHRYGEPAQKPPGYGCPEIFSFPNLDCASCGGESPTKRWGCAKPNNIGIFCSCMLAHIDG